jgi:ribokinase
LAKGIIHKQLFELTAFIIRYWPTIEKAVARLQLEIPLEKVVQAARSAHAAGVTVILDPAPARELPDELRGSIDILTPNESEAALLTGREPSPDAASAAACAAEVRARFDLTAAIVTLGGTSGRFEALSPRQT